MNAIDQETVKAAVAAALKHPPVRDDPQFVSAREGSVGAPALARTRTGVPAFWLVPLLVEGLACGLAQVDLAGRVTHLGILGGSPEDRASWIDPTFFEAPPRDVVTEIEATFPEATIAEPILSYDASPTRWAWRLEIRREGRLAAVAFIAPGDWYERSEDTFSIEKDSSARNITARTDVTGDPPPVLRIEW